MSEPSGSLLISIIDGMHQLWIRHTPEGPWHFVGVFNDMKLFAASQRGSYEAPPTAVLRKVTP